MTAVAIVSWNTRDLLRTCLARAGGERPSEVVVVDNGSIDGSVEMVRAEFPAVRLELLPDNPGYGAAANRAFATTASNYVVLLNPDALLRPGALAALTRHLDTHPQVAVVGPRLLNADGSLQRSCHGFPRPWAPAFRRPPLTLLVCRLGWMRERWIETWSHDRVRQVPWVTGAALAIRRDAFRQVGGFDERFHMYFEEVDFCYRLSKAGWETHFTPAAEVVHLVGASTEQRRRAMLLRGCLSQAEFFRAHYTGASLALALWVFRAANRTRIIRDSLRYLAMSKGARREQVSENLGVWHEALALGRPNSGSERRHQ
jgi:GT2 family glycosyltransferase